MRNFILGIFVGLILPMAIVAGYVKLVKLFKLFTVERVAAMRNFILGIFVGLILPMGVHLGRILYRILN